MCVVVSAVFSAIFPTFFSISCSKKAKHMACMATGRCISPKLLRISRRGYAWDHYPFDKARLPFEKPPCLADCKCESCSVSGKSALRQQSPVF